MNHPTNVPLCMYFGLTEVDKAFQFQSNMYIYYTLNGPHSLSAYGFIIKPYAIMNN